MKTVEELAEKHSLNDTYAKELHELIEEVIVLNFTKSKSLSRYITNNRLEDKYPNISGVVRMSNSRDIWDFEGGFPKNIYRIVCLELGLEDQGSTAKAITFTPYTDLK
ncbi:hypothetical protein DVY93_03655 [Psychrobacter sp. CCUG 69069]|uniref:Uncharacterized protein n=1 Tax=Psychrobacter namhaensis TaxID=292734 RepID=A0ABW8L9Q0_9GAMM|nr:hypothetical protein [Psychrobacter sp. CCUG 69069]MCD1278851.1 hypothetical protein [Psychrobacter sp. CCUG 69069]